MIELLLRETLTAFLGIDVYLERPDPAPLRYVLLEKTGSGKRNRLPSSTVAFQSYAETLYQAAVLNELVKGAVERLEELPEIGNVRLNSDYNFTDSSTKQYRYQAVYDIAHY